MNAKPRVSVWGLAHFVSCAALACSACMSPRGAVPPSPDAGAIAVEATALLAREESTGPSGMALARRVGARLRDSGEPAAQREVLRFADVAEHALASASGAADDELAVLARVFEAAFAGTGTPASGWFEMLGARRVDPAAFAEFDAARTRLLDALRAGRTRDACAACPLPLPRGVQANDALGLEAARLHGIALLLADRAADAARVFTTAFDAAPRERALTAAHLGLLACAAEQRANRSAAAAHAWERAVELASSSPAVDPGFWERGLALRPESAVWPRATTDALAKRVVAQLGDGIASDLASARPETLAWAVVAEQRLARGESQAALLAFARAGALAHTARLGGLLRVGEARALVHLGRADAARAALSTIAASSEPVLARAGLAWMGALELDAGRVGLARALLTRALDGDSTGAWPERAQAEANLGLALLMDGDEAAGLEQLRGAQARFASEGRTDECVLALENEIAYLDGAGRGPDATRARTELELARRR